MAGWSSLEHGMCVSLPCGLCPAVKTQFLPSHPVPKHLLLPPRMGEAKPCSHPAQDPEWRRAERESLPLEVQAPGGMLTGEQCSPPSLYLAVPKTRGPHVQKHVCVNGNCLPLDHPGTNKQVKMRFYADEIQLINKEDAIKPT